MIEFTTGDLFKQVGTYVWPLTRILGLFSSAPFFSHQSIPIRIRIALGFAVTLLIVPVMPPLANYDPISWPGLVILLQQLLIGITMGFIMRIIITCVELTGELVGMTMGFGFANFFNPETRAESSPISHLLSLLVLAMFIAADLHLDILQALIESFFRIPIGLDFLDVSVFKQIAYLGKELFNIGYQLSTPMLAALLATNLMLSVLSKAAPQLNLFGIGFPITMLVGFIIIGFSLAHLTNPMIQNLIHGMDLIRTLKTAHL
jgi:flagellar biosynthesis protein FliR